MSKNARWIVGSLALAILLASLIAQLSDRSDTPAETTGGCNQAVSIGDSQPVTSKQTESDQIAVEPPREKVEAEATAPESASALPLTVAERIGAIMTRMHERPRLPPHGQFRSEISVASLSIDPQVNPARKTLTAEQTAELEGLVAIHNEERKRLHDEFRAAHYEAATRALSEGHYIARPRGETFEAERDSLEAMKKELSQRLGTEFVDWRCHQIWTGRQGTEPPLTALVWYTAAGAPLAFQRTAQMTNGFEDLRARARAMFETR